MENVKLAPGPVFSVISIIPGEHCRLLGGEVLRERAGCPRSPLSCGRDTTRERDRVGGLQKDSGVRGGAPQPGAGAAGRELVTP